MTRSSLEDLLTLSAAERILLAQDLWDSVRNAPDAWQLTDTQRSDLARRLQEFRDNRPEGQTWQQVKARLRNGT